MKVNTLLRSIFHPAAKTEDAFLNIQLDNSSFFQEKHIPADSTLIGLSALVQSLAVSAPVRRPAAVSSKRFRDRIREAGDWYVFDNKFAVEPTVEAHLVFAFKHENLDLLVLKRIFEALPAEVLEAYVSSAPTGPVVRRIWFLYEFLIGRTLAVPDCGRVTAIDLLDGEKYFVSEGILSARHKVRNNLLGSRQFCPVVRRTEKLNKYMSGHLDERAQSLLDQVSPALIARAASFLLLADSQASFAIEGERLPMNTRERWLRAVQQVGSEPLSVDELHRLHKILIGDYRFTREGFRDDYVFLGHRSEENEPIPEFIGSKPDDIDELINALIEASQIMRNSALDAVVQAAALAFGFVYIHPYEDGNGRLHRCLIHHTLSEKKFSPPGLVFPVSSVMLKWINEYRDVLQAHSKPLMPYIQWRPTMRGNVEVLNDTADLYRYFDATEEAEFLYKCVEQAVENDVPDELDYLNKHDVAMRTIMDTVQMPNRLAENFIMFMRQNQWKLPKKRREDEFARLTDGEVSALESLVREAFSVS